MSYANNVWQALDGETAKLKQSLANSIRLGYRKPTISDQKKKRIVHLYRLYLKGI